MVGLLPSRTDDGSVTWPFEVTRICTSVDQEIISTCALFAFLNAHSLEDLKIIFASCYSPLVSPLGHLSPNGSLANLAALYPFNGLPDLHRHFKLAIILGLSESGQSAFVA